MTVLNTYTPISKWIMCKSFINYYTKKIYLKFFFVSFFLERANLAVQISKLHFYSKIDLNLKIIKCRVSFGYHSKSTVWMVSASFLFSTVTVYGILLAWVLKWNSIRLLKYAYQRKKMTLKLSILWIIKLSRKSFTFITGYIL